MTLTSGKYVSAKSQCHHKQVHMLPSHRSNKADQWIRHNKILGNLLFLPSGSLQHLRITYPFLYSTALFGFGTCNVFFKILLMFTVGIKTKELYQTSGKQRKVILRQTGNAIVRTSRKGLAPINTACSPAAPAARANSSTSELLQICTTQ